jgi:hypothetical protein
MIIDIKFLSEELKNVITQVAPRKKRYHQKKHCNYSDNYNIFNVNKHHFSFKRIR